MPIRSKAQWRALAAKMERGEISKRQFDEMVDKTPGSYRSLPERVGKKASKRGRKAQRSKKR